MNLAVLRLKFSDCLRLLFDSVQQKDNQKTSLTKMSSEPLHDVCNALLVFNLHSDVRNGRPCKQVHTRHGFALCLTPCYVLEAGCHTPRSGWGDKLNAPGAFEKSMCDVERHRCFINDHIHETEFSAHWNC